MFWKGWLNHNVSASPMCRAVSRVILFIAYVDCLTASPFSHLTKGYCPMLVPLQEHRTQRCSINDEAPSLFPKHSFLQYTRTCKFSQETAGDTRAFRLLRHFSRGLRNGFTERCHAWHLPLQCSAAHRMANRRNVRLPPAFRCHYSVLLEVCRKTCCLTYSWTALPIAPETGALVVAVRQTPFL